MKRLPLHPKPIELTEEDKIYINRYRWLSDGSIIDYKDKTCLYMYGELYNYYEWMDYYEKAFDMKDSRIGLASSK